MNNVTKRIFFLFCIFIFVENFGQQPHEYCYNSVNDDGTKTELKFTIFSDSSYIWKAGRTKKNDDSQSGKIMEIHGKTFLKTNNDTDNTANDKYQIKLKNKKVIILGYKQKKKFLNNEYHYVLENGMILWKNKCQK